MKSVQEFAGGMVVGALIGALVGAVVALLLAPSSGEELRAQIEAKIKAAGHEGAPGDAPEAQAQGAVAEPTA